MMDTLAGNPQRFACLQSLNCPWTALSAGIHHNRYLVNIQSAAGSTATLGMMYNVDVGLTVAYQLLICPIAIP